MKVLLSKSICDLLLRFPPREAARKGIQVMQEKVGGLGGVIGISPEGSYPTP